MRIFIILTSVALVGGGVCFFLLFSKTKKTGLVIVEPPSAEAQARVLTGRGSDWLESALDEERLARLYDKSAREYGVGVTTPPKKATLGKREVLPCEQKIQDEISQIIDRQSVKWEHVELFSGNVSFQKDLGANIAVPKESRKVWEELCEADLLEKPASFKYSALCKVSRRIELLDSDVLVVLVSPQILGFVTTHVFLIDEFGSPFVKVFDPVPLEAIRTGVLLCPISQFLSLKFYKSEEPPQGVAKIIVATTTGKIQSGGVTRVLVARGRKMQ